MVFFCSDLLSIMLGMVRNIEAKGEVMTAFNVVRYRVRPEFEEEFLRLNREVDRSDLAGLRSASLIKTGERSYCMIGEWDSMESIVAARPLMVRNLERGRGMLEDLGEGRGVTDAVSGEVVSELHRRG
ncbi:antibiotic biosynthesis monooxygenase [Mesorhizobium sp. LHD-90]|uniref:antibiotic biosynthesis monooxygenase n=1 Tax=Mesorhizobium sp. LHD-90 TaxID=3071414 RepID=UPI0027E131AB|nr:antibiotic biosynthesis monooxygenase [Mesorhizobium sp. LHD-90]MDQ6432928.1 antibiotic biosynthesis monooxygenase [Mesorhizobium sp. LHD-90]